MILRRIALLSLLALPLLTVPAWAESFLEFDVWMQRIDRYSQSVLLRLRQQDVPGAVADARALEALYLRMERFYESRGELDDPLLISYDGRVRAAEAARLAEAGQLQAAYDSALGIARDCRACHDRFKPLRSAGL